MHYLLHCIAVVLCILCLPKVLGRPCACPAFACTFQGFCLLVPLRSRFYLCSSFTRPPLARWRTLLPHRPWSRRLRSSSFSPHFKCRKNSSMHCNAPALTQCQILLLHTPRHRNLMFSVLKSRLSSGTPWVFRIQLIAQPWPGSAEHCIKPSTSRRPPTLHRRPPAAMHRALHSCSPTLGPNTPRLASTLRALHSLSKTFNKTTQVSTWTVMPCQASDC